MRCLIVAAGLMLGAGPASAHAFLKTATPAVGSTGAAPGSVAIEFSEAVEPRFSTITVLDDAGAAVQTEALGQTGAKTLSVGVKPLPPGRYKVVWHVTAVDTHKTEGSFTFIVAP